MSRTTFYKYITILELEFDKGVNCMSNAKNIVSIIMAAVLVALCLIAITCDLSIAVKCFAIFSAVYGFFELQKWRKKK